MLIGARLVVHELRATWRRLNQPSAQRRPQPRLGWVGLLAAVGAALSHGLIDLSYAVPDFMLIWVLITALPVFGAELIAASKSAEAAAPAD